MKKSYIDKLNEVIGALEFLYLEKEVDRGRTELQALRYKAERTKILLIELKLVEEQKQ